MKAVGIIPARLAAGRLFGKLEMDLCGVPVLARTVRRAMQAENLGRVVVSTAASRAMNVQAIRCRITVRLGWLYR